MLHAQTENMASFEGHATKRQRTEVGGRGVRSGTRVNISIQSCNVVDVFELNLEDAKW